MSEKPAEQTSPAAPSDGSPPTIAPLEADVHPAADAVAGASGVTPETDSTVAAEPAPGPTPQATSEQAPVATAQQPPVATEEQAPVAAGEPVGATEPTPEPAIPTAGAAEGAHEPNPEAGDAPTPPTPATVIPATADAPQADAPQAEPPAPTGSPGPTDQPSVGPVVPLPAGDAAIGEPVAVDAADQPLTGSTRRGGRWRLVVGVVLLFLVAIGLGFASAFLVPGLADVPVPSQAAQASSPPPSPSPNPTSTVMPSPSGSQEPTPSATATPRASSLVYVVQHGDILSAIAARYGVTVQAIVAANGLKDPNHIEPGQHLIIPLP